jgi:hypothetical protein
MKRIVILVAAIFVVMCAVVTKSAMAADDSRSVEIKRPFANIYEYLDPKSNIIKQARQGELFELVYAGTSWYQVRIKDRVGWLERRAGEIIDTPPSRFLGIPVGVFALFLVLLVLTLLGVALVIYRQINTEL